MAMRARPVAARVRSGESGWTLIELLVSSVILVVMLTAVLALLEATNAAAPRDQERANDLRERPRRGTGQGGADDRLQPPHRPRRRLLHEEPRWVSVGPDACAARTA